jgi:hypothetical protein
MKKTYRFFKPAISTRRILNYVLGILLVFTQSSCFKHFYQTNTMHTVDAASLEKLDSAGKSFIVHTPTVAFALKNVKVNSEMISGERDFSIIKHNDLLNPQAEKGNKMSNAEKNTCLSEVHLYTNDSLEGKSQIALPIGQINRMDVYGRDRSADRDSRVVSIIGIGVGVMAIVGIGIIAANSVPTFHLAY